MMKKMFVTESGFVPNSEKNEFGLLQIGDKADVILNDAINCPMKDGMISIHIDNADIRERFSNIGTYLMYAEATKQEILTKIYELVELVKQYHFSLYKVIHHLMKLLEVRKEHVKDNNVIDIKDIITNIISKEPDMVIGDNGIMMVQTAGVNNSLPIPQQIGVLGLINNINNSQYNNLTNETKWLIDTVKFLPTMKNIPETVVHTMYEMFNNQYTMSTVNSYGVMKNVDGTLFRQLEDYDLEGDKFTHAFAGNSYMYPDKVIVVLFNVNNRDCKIKLDDVSKFKA